MRELKSKLITIIMVCIILFCSIIERDSYAAEQSTANYMKAYNKFFNKNYSEEKTNVYLVDITHDGQNEMVITDTEMDNDSIYHVNIYTYKRNKVIKLTEITGSDQHTYGFLDLYVVKIKNKYYLYHLTSSMWQGYGWLKYEIFSFNEKGKKVTYKQKKVEGEPLSDQDNSEFYNKEKSYVKYIVYTIRQTGTSLTKEKVTSSKASEVFKTVTSNMYTYKFTPVTSKKLTDDQMSDIVKILKKRSSFYSDEISITTNKEQILIKSPDQFDSTFSILELTRQGKLEFVDDVGNVLISNSDVAGAEADEWSNGQYAVRLAMSKSGTTKLAQVTEKYSGQDISIYLDDYLLQTATIREKITSGDCYITGMNDRREADEVAMIIRYGCLPCQLEVVN